MGVNRVMLFGRVVGEPEIRYWERGRTLARVRLETYVREVDAAGQVQEYTDEHSVVFWDQVARNIEKLVHQGAILYLEGSLHTNSYTDARAIRRTITEVVARNFRLVGRSKPRTQESVTASTSTNYCPLDLGDVLGSPLSLSDNLTDPL